MFGEVEYDPSKQCASVSMEEQLDALQKAIVCPLNFGCIFLCSSLMYVLFCILKAIKICNVMVLTKKKISLLMLLLDQICWS